MPLSAGTKLGPYKIEALLGAGGMGEVYKALDTRLDRTVAVKVLSAHLSESPEAKRRFEREARAISSLNHPNICTLYDIGHQDGTDFLVMEYLEGETLADRLQKGPLPPEQVFRYGIEVCEGLDKAHKSGVIHRDLKPGNIMLTKSGAKLMDFGLAKATSDFGMKPREKGSENTTVFATPPPDLPLTVQGTVLGTIQYMAPEQLEGKEADERSDIFALGTVLYEMASGRAAFTGQSHASIVAAILTYQPPTIAMSQPLSPSAFDSLVKTCLAKDPDERWQTVHDVKLQLRWIAEAGSKATAPIPVAAGPASAAPFPAPGVAPPPPVPVKKSGSNKAVWTIVGVGALAAIGFVLVFLQHVPLPFGSVGDRASSNARQSPPVSENNAAPGTGKPAVVATGSDGSGASSEAREKSSATPPAPAAVAEKAKPNAPVDTTPLSEMRSKATPAEKAESAPVKEAAAVTPAVDAARTPAAPPGPTPGQLLQTGKTQLADQNAQAARESFKKAADGGNMQAAVLLGTMFAQGLGGPKSDWDAVQMFRKAADSGNARGMFNLALMYEAGRVVPGGKDQKTAAHWYLEAANRGDGDASYRLGLMYEEGRGVDKDLKEASRLYAKSGSADAKARLARLSQDGR